MTGTLIAACGTQIVSRLRKTFPAVAIEAESPVMRRRGRLLSHGEHVIAELPRVETMESPEQQEGVADFAAELAFYLGAFLGSSSVLLVAPAPQLIVADRITAPGRRELIPDLLEPTSHLDESVKLDTITHPAVWLAAEWALRRLAPHQFWVVGLPIEDQDRQDLRRERLGSVHSAGATHRGLRSILNALEQQTR